MMTMFWLEFWACLLRPTEDRPSAEVIDLAQWRREHPKRGAAA